MTDDRYYRDIPLWVLVADYRYEVAGQELLGTKATATDEADKVSEFPDGPSKQLTQWKKEVENTRAIMVYYDPAEPTESYLIYTESRALVTILHISWVLAAVGLALAVVPRLLR